jgi:hypothetical protein
MEDAEYERSATVDVASSADDRTDAPIRDDVRTEELDMVNTPEQVRF